jgi:hypothetical protein
MNPLNYVPKTWRRPIADSPLEVKFRELLQCQLEHSPSVSEACQYLYNFTKKYGPMVSLSWFLAETKTKLKSAPHPQEESIALKEIERFYKCGELAFHLAVPRPNAEAVAKLEAEVQALNEAYTASLTCLASKNSEEGKESRKSG